MMRTEMMVSRVMSRGRVEVRVVERVLREGCRARREESSCAE